VSDLVLDSPGIETNGIVMPREFLVFVTLVWESICAVVLNPRFPWGGIEEEGMRRAGSSPGHPVVKCNVVASAESKMQANWSVVRVDLSSFSGRSQRTISETVRVVSNGKLRRTIGF